MADVIRPDFPQWGEWKTLDRAGGMIEVQGTTGRVRCNICEKELGLRDWQIKINPKAGSYTATHEHSSPTDEGCDDAIPLYPQP